MENQSHAQFSIISIYIHTISSWRKHWMFKVLIYFRSSCCRSNKIWKYHYSARHLMSCGSFRILNLMLWKDFQQFHFTSTYLGLRIFRLFLLGPFSKFKFRKSWSNLINSLKKSLSLCKPAKENCLKFFLESCITSNSIKAIKLHLKIAS